MKYNKKSPILPALLAAAALFTLACGSSEETAGKISQAAIPLETPVDELIRQPQIVDVQESQLQESQPEDDLTARERELAARQAELEARERRLREREQQARAEESEPEPTRTAALRRPEADPNPEPAREEAPEEELARADEPKPADDADDADDAAPIRPALATYATLPSGTTFDVEFSETLSSATSSAGDSFRARVAHDVTEEGMVFIPAGSEVLGEVTEAVPVQRKVGGQARLALKFTDLVLPSGGTVPIEASFIQQGRNETGRDAATIGAGAAGGAILGRILKKGDRSKGGVIGAIIGAAAGAVIASRTPGEEVVIGRGTMASLRLDDNLEVRVAYSRR